MAQHPDNSISNYNLKNTPGETVTMYAHKEHIDSELKIFNYIFKMV
jgi:hypothetical protein